MAGALRISAEQFWRTTPREFLSMIDGFVLSKGGKRAPKHNPLTRREFEELKAKLG